MLIGAHHQNMSMTCDKYLVEKFPWTPVQANGQLFSQRLNIVFLNMMVCKNHGIILKST